MRSQRAFLTGTAILSAEALIPVHRRLNPTVCPVRWLQKNRHKAFDRVNVREYKPGSLVPRDGSQDANLAAFVGHCGLREGMRGRRVCTGCLTDLGQLGDLS